MREEPDFEEVHAERAARRRTAGPTEAELIAQEAESETDQSWSAPSGSLGEKYWEAKRKVKKLEKKQELWEKNKWSNDPAKQVMAQAAVEIDREIPTHDPHYPDGAYQEISEPVGPDELYRLGLSGAKKMLRGARDLIEGLPPEEREDVHRYVSGRATEAAKRMFKDWSKAREFVETHLPEPLGDRSPYLPDGGLRNVDVMDLDMDVPWLVKPYLPGAQVGLLVGENNMGKSLATAALGGAVSTGGEWLGYPVEEPGHVLYILSEGVREYPKRLGAWFHHEGLLPSSFTREELRETLDGRVDIVDGKVWLTDPRLEENLIASVEANGTRLVVCDILSKLLGRDHHEDNSETAQLVTSLMSSVAERTGATCLLVHHILHSGNRARGSHAWQDNVDFEYTVADKGKPAKERFARGVPTALENTKVKEDRRCEPLGYRLKVVSMECDGKEWRKATVVSADVGEKMTTADAIRLFVQDNPGATKSAVTSNVEGRSSDVGAEIDRRLASGHLVNENEGKSGPWALYLAGDWEPAEEVFDADGEAPDLSDITDEGPNDA